ncbi:MAG: Heimdall-CTERM domain-containing surface protein [Candidatus Hodarchaeales archaeon]
MKKAAPGFELSLVFITLVISSVFASRKRRNR